MTTVRVAVVVHPGARAWIDSEVDLHPGQDVDLSFFVSNLLGEHPVGVHARVIDQRETPPRFKVEGLSVFDWSSGRVLPGGFRPALVPPEHVDRLEALSREPFPARTRAAIAELVGETHALQWVPTLRDRIPAGISRDLLLAPSRTLEVLADVLDGLEAEAPLWRKVAQQLAVKSLLNNEVVLSVGSEIYSIVLTDAQRIDQGDLGRFFLTGEVEFMEDLGRSEQVIPLHICDGTYSTTIRKRGGPSIVQTLGDSILATIDLPTGQLFIGPGAAFEALCNESIGVEGYLEGSYLVDVGPGRWRVTVTYDGGEALDVELSPAQGKEEYHWRSFD